MWEPREPRTVREFLYFLWFLEYSATIWNTSVLADRGLTAAEPRIRKAAERLFQYKPRLSSRINLYHEEMCAVGNAARTLTLGVWGRSQGTAPVRLGPRGPALVQGVELQPGRSWDSGRLGAPRRAGRAPETKALETDGGGHPPRRGVLPRAGAVP